MNVTFYRISKKNNSSSRPQGDGITLNVALKEGSGMVRPSLEIYYKDLFKFNYCYIDFFSRYYFITNVDSIANNTYEVSLESDVLANFSAIGQQAYIEYSSSHYNVMLNDNRIVPIAKEITNTKTVFALSGLTNWNNPSSLVSVVGKNGNVGGSNIYVGRSMTGVYNIAQTLINLFSTKEFWEKVVDVIGNFNPLDYINGAWIVPYNYEECHAVGTVQTVLWETTVSGTGLDNNLVIPQSVTVAIPECKYTDFRKSAAYQRYNLYIPLCGTMSISPTDLLGESSIEINYACDCITGDMQVTVRTSDSNKIIGMLSSNNKADLPVSWKNGNTKMLQGGLGIGKSIAGAALSSPQLFVEGVAEVGKALLTQAEPQSFGSAGGIAGISASPGLPYLQLIEYDSSVSPDNLTTIAGRPLFEVSTLNSGYNQTRQASVSLEGAAKEETEMYNKLLDGGAYL